LYKRDIAPPLSTRFLMVGLMSGYVLIISIASLDGVTTQNWPGNFVTYDDCVQHAAGWVESQRPHYPDAKIRWDCLPLPDRRWLNDK
jgi:hypothetical protein